MTCLPDITGEYKIIYQSNPKDDTTRERITIGHISDMRFSIASIDGPTGEWMGYFTIDKDRVSGKGEYRYNTKGHFGKHTFKIDPACSRIEICGKSSRPKLPKLFSYTLERVSLK